MVEQRGNIAMSMMWRYLTYLQRKVDFLFEKAWLISLYEIICIRAWKLTSALLCFFMQTDEVEEKDMDPLHEIIDRDPLAEVSEQEKDFLWKMRYAFSWLILNVVGMCASLVCGLTVWKNWLPIKLIIAQFNKIKKVFSFYAKMVLLNRVSP